VLIDLELRRLHHDFIYTYKVLFGKTSMDCANMFSVARYTTNPLETVCKLLSDQSA